MQVQVNHTKIQFFCLFPVLCLKKKNLCAIPQKWAFERGVSLTMREKTHFWRSSGTCMYAHSSRAFLYCHNCCHLIKPPLRRPCRRRGWDLCVYVCMHKNKIKKLWHHCHEQLVSSTPSRENSFNTTHKSSDSSKRNSKDSNNGSKAKTIKGTWKHSKEKGTSKQGFKKGISQTEIKGVFHLHKSSINVSTYITGASMQAAGSLDLSSVATPPSPIKGGDCPSSIDSPIFKKSKTSGDNQSVISSPC